MIAKDLLVHFANLVDHTRRAHGEDIMNQLDESRNILRADFEGRAHETSSDRRRELLYALAKTVDAVPDAIIAEYGAVFLRWSTEATVLWHDSLLKQVGHSFRPTDATEFVQTFIEMANTEGRRLGEKPTLRRL
jgi:hypothetical protein